MRFQVVEDSAVGLLRPANELENDGEDLDTALASSVSDDGFVVFERDAVWPHSLGSELAGRRGVVVLAQQPNETHDELLRRVRQRAARLSDPVGQLVWVASAETKIRWEALLRALFASDEFGPQCLFSAYSGENAAVLGLDYASLLDADEAAPRWSMVRLRGNSGVAESA